MPRIRQLGALGKLILAVSLLLIVGVAAAVAAPKPPSVLTPTITSAPSNPTAATMAVFTFTHPQSVTFSCTIDKAKAAACGSGTSGSASYPNLAAGSHTFQVVAQSGGASSAPATFTWTIDLTPPTVTISYPASNGVYGPSSWNPGCPCGTATDASGVSSVQVVVQQQATGKYWNGTSYVASTTPVLNPASVSGGNWSYTLPLPSPDGSYVLSVKASDSVGNMTTSSVVTTFTIDATPPPAPTITQAPSDPTNSTTAQFTFADAEANATFQCALDGSPLSACSAKGVTYKSLALGQHTFQVAAVDQLGNVSNLRSYSWMVVTGSFTISGSPTLPLSPGAQSAINLVIGNPLNFPIKVTDVTISIGTPSNPGCSAADFVVGRPFTGPVTVPANSTKSLSDLGISSSVWPAVQMLNTTLNQDACKATTLNLTYSGTATQ